MANTGRSPRLARNAALAALVILGSTAAVTASAVRPGTGTEDCPGGEDWVIAQPVEATMAGAHGDHRTDPGVPGGSSTSGGSARTPARPATPPAVGSARAVAAPLTLAGCVDTERLHPMPASGDGRG
jgi:hypothetical protein